MVEAPRMHPLTLRFRDRAWERAFDDDRFAAALGPLRVALVLGFAITGGWLAWAVTLHPELLTSPATNYPFPFVVLGVLLLTFTPFFKRWMPPLFNGVMALLTVVLALNYAMTPDVAGTEAAAAVCIAIGLVVTLSFNPAGFA